MNTFGDKRYFAIQYQFVEDPYDEYGILKQSWGEMEIWIQGKTVMNFYKNGILVNYHWNLIDVIEWLCNNLQFIVTEDKFPYDIKGNDAITIIKNSYKVNIDDEEEFDEYLGNRYEWVNRHNWFGGRGGSFLQDMAFYRVKDSIEISWDSDKYFKIEGVKFLNNTGVEYVDLDVFVSTVKAFLNNALDALIETDPNNAELLTLKHKEEIITC